MTVVVCASAQRSQPQRLIYDDDCTQDVDCVATLPVLYALEDRHEIQVLAMMANSANPQAAPVMKLFAKYGGHPETAIGANPTDEPSNPLCSKYKCNMSKWAAGLVDRFDPGDTRAAYPDCVALYRQVLAKQPAHSVTIVETGFATCLNRLLLSPPDRTSKLTGAELVKRKVKMLSVMGGKYPAGAEWNFECDSPGYNKLFQLWTRQHGFPPVYLNGFANGFHILVGAPAGASPNTNPTRYAMQLEGTDQRPAWDLLSALFAARGLTFAGVTYFSESAAGTVVVDPATGVNSWTTDTDSGHYVLTNAASDEVFAALLDGFTHTTGFLASLH